MTPVFFFFFCSCSHDSHDRQRREFRRGLAFDDRVFDDRTPPTGVRFFLDVSLLYSRFYEIGARVLIFSCKHL